MSTIAVLPVKRFDSAKARLAADLGKGTRKALVEAMLTDVLIALRRSTRIDRVLVVTGDPQVEALAYGYDHDAMSDAGEPSHSAAAVRGAREAHARGARRVLLVAGDCPAMDPKEVDALLAERRGDPSVVVVPDRHGTGTNALLLAPPEVMEPAFGEDSRERHERLATAAGVSATVADVPSLSLDVDTLDDLEALRTALENGHGGAAHTRGMLSRLSRRA